MCSVQETSLDLNVNIKPATKDCIKCKTTKATVLIRHSTYCKKCFQHVFVGKFRKNVEKSRISSNSTKLNGCGEKVMIGFSGGPTMLQLINEYNETHPHETSKKCAYSEIIVCHIDESVLFNYDSTSSTFSQESTILQVEKIVQKYNYPFIGLYLQDIFNPDVTKSGCYSNVLELAVDDAKILNLEEGSVVAPTEKLLHLLNNVSKSTAKEDFVWYLKLCYLIFTARKNGCKRLFLGDCSSRLSIKIISQTSKGRGFSLPLETSGEIDWFE
ncbi:637_t:CDS:2, partial [Funneliformis mosseae]